MHKDIYLEQWSFEEDGLEFDGLIKYEVSLLIDKGEACENSIVMTEDEAFEALHGFKGMVHAVERTTNELKDNKFYSNDIKKLEKTFRSFKDLGEIGIAIKEDKLEELFKSK